MPVMPDITPDTGFYGKPEDVRLLTGCKPKDLGESNDEALTLRLKQFLTEATSYVDTCLGRSYTYPVPAGITSIANRIAANMVMVAIQRRQSPVVQVSDFNFTMVKEEVLTKAIREDLDLYKVDDEVKRRPSLALGISNRTTREA